MKLGRTCFQKSGPLKGPPEAWGSGGWCWLQERAQWPVLPTPAPCGARLFPSGLGFWVAAKLGAGLPCWRWLVLRTGPAGQGRAPLTHGGQPALGLSGPGGCLAAFGGVACCRPVASPFAALARQPQPGTFPTGPGPFNFRLCPPGQRSLNRVGVPLLRSEPETPSCPPGRIPARSAAFFRATVAGGDAPPSWRAPAWCRLWLPGRIAVPWWALLRAPWPWLNFNPPPEKPDLWVGPIEGVMDESENRGGKNRQCGCGVAQVPARIPPPPTAALEPMEKAAMKALARKNHGGLVILPWQGVGRGPGPSKQSLFGGAMPASAWQVPLAAKAAPASSRTPAALSLEFSRGRWSVLGGKPAST